MEPDGYETLPPDEPLWPYRITLDVEPRDGKLQVIAVNNVIVEPSPLWDIGERLHWFTSIALLAAEAKREHDAEVNSNK